MMLDPLRQIILNFSGAYKGMKLYPPQHPAVKRQVQELWQELDRQLRDRKSIKLGIMEGTLFIEDQLLAEGTPAAVEVERLLEIHELEGLEFQAGLREEEIQVLLETLGRQGIDSDGLAGIFRKKNVDHIRLSATRKEDEPKLENPRKIYGRALKVVEKIFQDVRMGKIPSSNEALSVVRSMVQITLAEPHALFALSMLKDYDNYTFTHSVNVSVIALAVGRACDLSEEKLRTLGFGGLLHDLGKLKIDHAIINKPGRLTDEEFSQIKTHPRMGAELVTNMEGVTPEVIDIVLAHHLRYDSQGYPADLQNANVSEMAYMAAIADTYDAITTLRSYQRPMTPRKAVARLRELVGTVLHPKYTEPFITSLGTFPVGSLVRLKSNEIGLVVWVDTRDPDSVRLKILFDKNGNRLDKPVQLDLFGEDARRIVSEVDPYTKGVEVTDYFEWGEGGDLRVESVGVAG